MIFVIIVGLFMISATDMIGSNIHPILDVICPVLLLLLIPTVRINKTQTARFLEKAGNRSLGLYLISLPVINLFLYGMLTFVPWAFDYKIALGLLLFCFTLFVPLAIMDFLSKAVNPSFSRYVFGRG